jgi:hypothetical protein
MRFEKRVQRLESSAGFGEVVFRLRSGARAGIRRKELLVAIGQACEGAQTRRAQILLNAERASDTSHLHTMVQAIASGPVPQGMVNE